MEVGGKRRYNSGETVYSRLAGKGSRVASGIHYTHRALHLIRQVGVTSFQEGGRGLKYDTVKYTLKDRLRRRVSRKKNEKLKYDRVEHGVVNTLSWKNKISFCKCRSVKKISDTCFGVALVWFLDTFTILKYTLR